MAQWINQSHLVKNKTNFSNAIFSLKLKDVPAQSSRLYSVKKHQPLTNIQIKRCCDILGVPINASVAKIKQAYYKKSFLVHPDRNKHTELAAKRFNEISDAYKLLITHKKFDEVEDHHFSWQNDHKSPSVRPWFKSRTKPNHHSSTKYASSNDFQEQFFGNDEPSEEQDHVQHTSASAWAGKFYKEQLQKDFESNTKLRERRLKANKSKHNDDDDDKCTIM